MGVSYLCKNVCFELKYVTYMGFCDLICKIHDKQTDIIIRLCVFVIFQAKFALI